MNPQTKTRIDARAWTTSTAQPITATGTNKGYCRFIFASCGLWDCATPNTVSVTASEMAPISKSFGCKNLANKFGSIIQFNTVHFTLTVKEHCLIWAVMGLLYFVRWFPWHTHSHWLIAVMIAWDITFKPPAAGFEEEISNFEMKSNWDNFSVALTQNLLNTCYERHLTEGAKISFLPSNKANFLEIKVYKKNIHFVGNEVYSRICAHLLFTFLFKLKWRRILDHTLLFNSPKLAPVCTRLSQHKKCLFFFNCISLRVIPVNLPNHKENNDDS